MVDYPGFAEKQLAARAEGRLIGLGICVYHQLSGTGPFEGASVRVDPSGQVTVNAGSAPQGQGTATMLAQIVADELQVDHETIKCVFGDTGRIAFGIGTFASRNAVMAGTSVQMASIKVREKALELAAHLLEADPADLEFVDGAFAIKGSPQSRKSLTDVAAAAAPGGSRPAGMDPDLESVQYFESMAAPYSFGIHIAEADVDPATGQVEITRYCVVNDAGVIINPLVAEGQIAGDTCGVRGEKSHNPGPRRHRVAATGGGTLGAGGAITSPVTPPVRVLRRSGGSRDRIGVTQQLHRDPRC
jgi:carbon-monoxide dehydrogenase large subunit